MGSLRNKLLSDLCCFCWPIEYSTQTGHCYVSAMVVTIFSEWIFASWDLKIPFVILSNCCMRILQLPRRFRVSYWNHLIQYNQNSKYVNNLRIVRNQTVVFMTDVPLNPLNSITDSPFALRAPLGSAKYFILLFMDIKHVRRQLLLL